MQDIKLLGLFPGQGSQSVGMGKELFDKFDEAKKIFRIADEVLNFPLSKICFEGPDEKLVESDITQPAILTVSTICFNIWKETANNSDIKIVSGVGHSLGEYSALVASNAIKFEDAVHLVHKRGEFMKTAVPLGVGKMTAIIGATREEIINAISEIKSGFVDIANFNSPSQIVIGGEIKAVDDVKEKLSGKKLIDLNVSAPFHTKMMASAGEKLKEELKKVTILTPEFPIFSNYTGDEIKEPEKIKESLYFQSFSKVYFEDSIYNIIKKYNPTNYYEFGNGKVLSGLLRKITKDIKPLS